MLKLVIGSSGSGKTHYLCQKMLSEVFEDNTRNYIYIVPEQYTLESQKKMVAMNKSMHGLSGVMNIDIVSFNRLSYRVFEEQGVNTLSVLDDTGKTLILRRIIEEHKDEFNIYKDKSKMLGFVAEVKSVISELYQYGIDVENIEEIIDRLNGHSLTKEKLLDIKIIYEYFREYVSNMTDSNAKYITKEEVLEELTRYIHTSKWISRSTIVLDGYTGFTPVQLKVISMLLEQAKDVIVSVTIRVDDIKLTNVGFENITKQELFNMSKTTINSLYSLANEKMISICEPVILDEKSIIGPKNNELRHLEKNIFNTEINVYENESNCIKIIKNNNSNAEAKCISNLISKYMKENREFRYRDFGIVVGDDSLLMTLHRELIDAGIPHFMDNKKSIIRNPFVDTIRGLLEMVDKDFTYDSVFRYLRCYMTDISHEDIDIFENYCLAMGIRGWNAYSNIFKKKGRKYTEEELEIINEIRNKFIEPITVFKAKCNNSRVIDITKAIYEFIVDMGLKDKINSYTELFEKERNDVLKSEYKQVYRKVMELFDKIVMLMGDEVISFNEYRKIIDDGFEEIKVGIIPLSVDEVMVGDILRTRLGNIKILIVMGANDGIIPKHSTTGGLLSQNDRRCLKNLDITLSPTIRESSFIQRFYMYLAMTKPTEELIITYSDMGTDGNNLRPSYIIEEVTRLYKNPKSMITKGNSGYIKDLSSKSLMFEYLVEHLKDYESEEFGNKLKELLIYCKNDNELKNRLYKAIDGMFYGNVPVCIEEAVARTVYGDGIVTKATRLEKYAACAYKQFIEYGLKLAKRDVYEIKQTDIGNIYHRCVELFTKMMNKNNIKIDDINEAKRKEMIHECMEIIKADESNHVFFSTKRSEFILDKCEKVADKTIWALLEHLKKGEFKIDNIELNVENGRIDRVDAFEVDDRKYMKIIDYKSGNKKFSPVKVANGLDMQLMFYMDSVLERERNINKGKVIEPAAVFYFNIKNPILEYEKSLECKEIYEEALLKEYMMTGFVNNDEEVFRALDKEALDDGKKTVVFGGSPKAINEELALSKTMGQGFDTTFYKFINCVKDIADKFAKDIVRGNVELNPYKMGEMSACSYCNYGDICVFDAKNFNEYNVLMEDKKESIQKVVDKIMGNKKTEEDK